MKPGRELDALVAEKVFGGKVVDHHAFGRPDKHFLNPDGSLTAVPPYSTNIAAAWLVLEHLAGYQIEKQYSGTFKAVLIEKGDGVFHDHHAEAATAEHAICLAALKACNL